jgi:hypothetical protein
VNAADTTISELTKGVVYWFRFRTTIGRTTSDWYPHVELVVH